MNQRHSCWVPLLHIVCCASLWVLHTLLWLARSRSAHTPQTGQMCRTLPSLGTSPDNKWLFRSVAILQGHCPATDHPLGIILWKDVWLGLAHFWFEGRHKPRWWFASDFLGFLFIFFPDDRPSSLLWNRNALYNSHTSAPDSVFTRFCWLFPLFSPLQKLPSDLLLCVSVLPSEPVLCSLSVAPCGVSSIR